MSSLSDDRLDAATTDATISDTLGQMYADLRLFRVRDNQFTGSPRV